MAAVSCYFSDPEHETIPSLVQLAEAMCLRFFYFFDPRHFLYYKLPRATEATRLLNIYLLLLTILL